MKEKDAKKKWCPMIRFEIGPHNETWQNNGYTNRGGYYSPQNCLCIGSDCAMWVWTDTESVRENGEDWAGKCGLSK